MAVGIALIAASCGSDSKGSNATTAGTTGGTTAASTATTAASTATTAGGAATTAASTGGAAMTITYDINPKAVWEDGSPITVADFKCTWEAQLNTPGSILTSGNDQITSVEAGSSDKQAVVKLKTTYAPFKTLFNPIIKKAAVANCSDISGDFGTEMKISGREWKIDSWSPDQVTFSPNPNYWGTNKPVAKQLVMVPRPDNEIEALKAGEVDFIYPQFHAGIQDELADPNVKTVLNYGGDYESIYMNLKPGRPFEDPALREAFYKSIDLDALFKQIYIPIAADGKLLTCGPIIPGKYCPTGIFGNKFDQAGADKVMTDAGYAKGSDGFWAKGGTVPDIKWMINAGNKRREDTQSYLIPLLAKAGFKVTADNCDAGCVFQQRQPAGDYDLAMYISTAPPDPGYLTPAYAGDQIPTDANGNVGQNFQWWSNDTATKALHDADKEVDETKRAALIQTALKEMDKDYIMIPTFQFPKSGAYRTDKVGKVEGQLNNYRAFNDEWQWTDLDGDGKVIIGAEQWPGCLNPTTECANSSWYQWTTANMVLPGVWDTTNDAGYALTDLVTGEPKVEIGG
jgi:peptide/nickel transport system substrate-binding protein